MVRLFVSVFRSSIRVPRALGRILRARVLNVLQETGDFSSLILEGLDTIVRMVANFYATPTHAIHCLDKEGKEGYGRGKGREGQDTRRS